MQFLASLVGQEVVISIPSPNSEIAAEFSIFFGTPK